MDFLIKVCPLHHHDSFYRFISFHVDLSSFVKCEHTKQGDDRLYGFVLLHHAKQLPATEPLFIIKPNSLCEDIHSVWLPINFCCMNFITIYM